MAAITDLAPEIFTMIITLLADRDLLHLRQTCKQISGQTSPLAIKIYFTKRSLIFEKRSLEALVNISQHPVFSQCVRSLEICPAHLLPLDELPRIESLFRSRRKPRHGMRNRTRFIENHDASTARDQINETAYAQSLASQEELIQSGHGMHCLTQALKQLVNCREIFISDEVSSSGPERIFHEVGARPQMTLTFESESSVAFVRHLMHAVSTAMVASDMRIKVFRVLISRLRLHGSRISPDMLTWPSSSLLHQATVSSLESLQLLLNPNCPEPEINSEIWAADLVQFIQRFPELSKLTIKMQCYDAYDVREAFIWRMPLANRELRSRFSELSSILHVPNLQVLDLGGFDCTAEELSTFLIYHSPTLRQVRLHHINVIRQGRDWTWLLGQMRESLDLTYLAIYSCLNHGNRLTRESRQRLEVTDEQGYDDIISQIVPNSQ